MDRQPLENPIRVSADVGGTFTDVAFFEHNSGILKLGKSLTTPHRLVEGVSNGLSRAGADFAEASLFLHGSTVAINTMLERTGSRTALLTTRGFRDVYEIGRINRPDAYNLFFRKHRPLVERELRLEVEERTMASGEIVRSLTEEELERVAIEVERAEVEAIAIIFLHSYRNPSNEIQAKEYFVKRFPNTFVTASHELSNEYREYERTSTVAANAYIGPRVRAYLKDMSEHIKSVGFKGSFFVVQSSGGLYGLDQASHQCVRMLESGPAAGVIATKALCDTLSLTHAIAFDMGGTTAKAGIIRDGRPLMANSVMVGGYNEGLPIQTSMIDIREVGTGGGSIAGIDRGGALYVGPRSAGAAPGPACYGLGGTEPTVTDAHLVLGRLIFDRFLGGDLKLDANAARAAIERRIAQPLGFSVEAAAEGIVRIATATMSNVVKQVTIERGLDVKDSTIVCFGGAGPLHASLVARELRIERVIVPNAPGHFSAIGMLVSDLRRDFARTVFYKLDGISFDELEQHYVAMEDEGIAEIRSASGDVRTEIIRGADMRYVGQEHAVYVEIPGEAFRSRNAGAIKQHFDRAHELNYGFANEKESAEIVSIRCAVIGALSKPSLPRHEKSLAEPGKEASLGNRRTYVNGSWQETRSYARSGLKAGNRIVGPALVIEHASTTVAMPGDQLEVDEFGNLVIEVDRS